MRKRHLTPTPHAVRSRGEGWLDLEHSAVVEVTSEEPDYPVEFELAHFPAATAVPAAAATRIRKELQQGRTSIK